MESKSKSQKTLAVVVGWEGENGVAGEQGPVHFLFHPSETMFRSREDSLWFYPIHTEIDVEQTRGKARVISLKTGDVISLSQKRILSFQTNLKSLNFVFVQLPFTRWDKSKKQKCRLMRLTKRRNHDWFDFDFPLQS